MKHPWRRLWRSARDERDLDDEIAFHLAQEEELRMERGERRNDARAAARREFGNVGRVKEVTRDMVRWHTLETLAQDVRFGLRLLARSKAFAVFCIASLALGIGATTAIYTLFDAIVLRPLPVRNPDELVALSFSVQGRGTNFNLPYPQFARMRQENRTLDGLFAWSGFPRMNVDARGHAEMLSGIYASGDYYRTLGLVPAAGRLLTPDDDRPGHATSVVISHGYWQRRFGGDPAAVGSTLTLNRVPFTIVGVEPRGYSGPNVGTTRDLTLPLRAIEQVGRLTGDPWQDPFATWIEIMGRLRPGVTIDQAARDLGPINRQVYVEAGRDAAPGTSAARAADEVTLNVVPGARGGMSGLRRGYERWLRLMLFMLGTVVLLASLNLATLMLARAEMRRNEITTRLAIGAGRGRIVRQLTTESLLIALGGGALGVPIAWGLGWLLLDMALSRPSVLPVDLTPDARTVAFALIASTLACLLFGLFPALRSTSGLRSSPARALGAPRQGRLEAILVGSQTALSLVLIVLAALFVRSLVHLSAVDTGFDRSNVLMFSVDAAFAGKQGSEIPDTYRAILDELERMPGAERASVSAVRPVSDSYYFVTMVTAIGERALDDRASVPVAYNLLSPGYFATIGVPIVAGRDFDRRDTSGAAGVVIISERLARRFEGSPVGQRIRMGPGDGLEVIGVARDHRYANVKDTPRDVVYFPIFQSAGKDMWYSPTFEIRYRGSQADLCAARARRSPA